MKDISQWKLAMAAKEFAESEFGELYLHVFREAKDEHLKTAMFTASSMEQKALIVEHAAGIAEMIRWVDDLVFLADNPEMLKEEKGDGQEDS